MADDKTAEAVDIVARHLVANVVREELGDQWGMYPELIEDDWNAVDTRVTAIIDNLLPAQEGFEAAYEYLEWRAEQWTKQHGTQG